MNERVYFDYYNGAHAGLGAKHRWFVRFSAEQTKPEPYYIDGNIEDVIADACEWLSDTYVEVIDNTWTYADFASKPYAHCIGIYTTAQRGEKWRSHIGEDYGYERADGSWQYLNYFEWRTRTSAQWWPELNVLRVAYGALSVEPNGDGFRLSTQTGIVLRDYIKRDTRGLCPHDLRHDVIIPAINEMRVQRLKGGYEPLVARIIEAFDVHVSEIKEAIIYEMERKKSF